MKSLGFIARAECREVKAFDGTVLTGDGEVVTLAVSDGYPQCNRGASRGHAFVFRTADDARAKAKNWNGMPWYFQLKPGTLRIFEVVEVEPAKAAVTEEREVP